MIYEKEIAEKIHELDPKLALEYLDTQNPKHYLLLSQCFFKIQKFTNSLSFANKFISSNPREISGFLNGGWISIRMENFEEASNFFDMALGIDKWSPDAIYGKGLALKKKGKEYGDYQLILSQIDKELVI